MGRIKKAVLTGVTLLGIGTGIVYYDMKNVVRAKIEEDRRKPHSAFLDAPLGLEEELDYYIDYRGASLAGEEIRKGISSMSVSRILDQLKSRYDEISADDVDFLLTHDDYMLADWSIRFLANREDRRIAPYLVEDLTKKAAGNKGRYDIYLVFSRIRNMHIHEAEPILLGMLRNESMRENALSTLAELGNERALRYFIDNENWDNVAGFVNMNRSRGFIHNYRDRIVPAMVRQLGSGGGRISGMWGDRRDCTSLMPYASALRVLDRQQAENYAHLAGNDCAKQQLVRDTLLGKIGETKIYIRGRPNK